MAGSDHLFIIEVDFYCNNIQQRRHNMIYDTMTLLVECKQYTSYKG